MVLRVLLVLLCCIDYLYHYCIFVYSSTVVTTLVKEIGPVVIKMPVVTADVVVVVVIVVVKVVV